MFTQYRSYYIEVWLLVLLFGFVCIHLFSNVQSSHDQYPAVCHLPSQQGLVRSPDGFGRRHVCGGATVAGLHLHTHSFILVRQRGVQEGGARGGVGARWQDPRWGTRVTAASSPCHHGKLVRPCSSGVVQVIWRGGGLEWSILSLVGSVCRVRRRQVGVVPPCGCGCHGRCHGDAEGAVRDRVV